MLNRLIRCSQRSSFAALAAVCVMSATPVLAATAHWRGSVAQGRAIEVRSINGDVFAEGYDGSDVQVEATVAGPDGVVSPVAVQAVTHARGVTICAVVDNKRQCLDDDSPSGAKAAGPRVNFTVKVPHGVSLIGRTVNGVVDAQRLDSDVEAYTTNGRISIQTTGSAQARTVNGSIVASLGNPFWRKAGEFQTVNGSINVSLPETASTRLFAQTVTGRVSNAFRIRHTGTAGDKYVLGNIGGGGSLLKLKTINGSIQLTKASRS